MSIVVRAVALARHCVTPCRSRRGGERDGAEEPDVAHLLETGGAAPVQRAGKESGRAVERLRREDMVAQHHGGNDEETGEAAAL